MTTSRKTAAAAPRSSRTGKSARGVSAHLEADVVIAGAVGRRKTGAQAIAPDHSPRAPVSSKAPPLPVAVAAPGDTHREGEQFLYRQAELLDGKHWQAWIDLFADDGMYWMPVSADQTDWLSWPSIFIEDKSLMAVRMGRVTHPNAWSQAPLWATNHLVSHVTVESADTDELVVRSRFHMMELRRDSIRHFGGSYRHHLARTAAGLKIRQQRVDLFNAQAPFDYVLQVWV